MLILLLSTVLPSVPHAAASAYRLSTTHAPGQIYGHIRLMGSLKLELEDDARELSGLAWDEHAQRLYAISDSGQLVHRVPRFSKGWRLDNFEGLAHHRGGRYFMVSDDNRSPLQKTLLVYFEILGE